MPPDIGRSIDNIIAGLLFGLVLLFGCRLPAAPFPSSPLIGDLEFDWSTHRRQAQGSDNFQLAWADDGHLYGAWGDGGGFGGSNSRGRVALGVARIEGDAPEYRGFNVWGGYAGERPATFGGKSWGMIGLAGVLHMWVVPDAPDGKRYRNHYEYVELASSSDHGATWRKAPWRFHQREDLTIPTFLNFGRGGEGMPVGFGDYVYTYFVAPESPLLEHQGPDGVGLIVHRPGRLHLARVLRGQVALKREAYEFFSGFDAAGRPVWGDIQSKAPVFIDPDGVGWCLSAVWHPTLRRVLLCTEHDASAKGALGFFDAPTPWGPWTTVKYFSKEQPFGDARPGSQLPWKPNVFFAAFASKWFDGDRFTLNFTGAGQGKDNDSFNTVAGRCVRR